MLTRVDDTIVAVASAAGSGVRAIVRLSGPAALDCAGRCFQSLNRRIDQTTRTTILSGQLRVDEFRHSIPCEAYVWPGRRSYTRQPSIEFHIPGSPPIASAVVQQLCRDGARMAAPGEFTMRAFLAGRIDLTQVDAVLGTIDATSGAELSLALRQMSGGVAQCFAELRERLLEVLADVEAGLDFVDEDIHFISADETAQRLNSVETRIAELETQFQTRTDTLRRPRVVLRGKSNVGKSSLLNALAGENAALVANQPGTTRDYVTRAVKFSGVEVALIDTAGVDDSNEPPAMELSRKAEAIAREQHQHAQLTLHCLDASQPIGDDDRSTLTDSVSGRLIVWTKSDLVSPHPAIGLATSVVTGQGLAELRGAISNWARGGDSLDANAGEKPFANNGQFGPANSILECPVLACTADRCLESLRTASDALKRAQAVLAARSGDELVAFEIRLALDHLGRIAGSVVTDDLLDRIFSRFCIGK